MEFEVHPEQKMNRRKILALSSVGITALSGCLWMNNSPAETTETDDTLGGETDSTKSPIDTTSAEDPETTSETRTDGTERQNIDIWPMFQFDARNSGYVPRADGPTATSEQVWRFETSGTITSPPVGTTNALFVGNENGDVYYLDRETGVQRRQFSVRGPATVGLFENRLIVSSGPRPQSGAQGSGAYEYDFTMFEPQTGKELNQMSASANKEGPPIAPPTITETGVLQLTAQERGVGFGEDKTDHEITLFGSTENDYFHWRHTADGGLSGEERLVAPAFADGIVYIPTVSVLRAIDTSNAAGEQLWVFQANAPINTAPSLDSDHVYVGTETGSVYALNTANGLQEWQTSLGDRVRASPVVADSTIYVGCDDGILYALDKQSGERKWSFKTDGNGTLDRGKIRAAPVVVNDAVYIGTTASRCYAVDTVSGDQLWTFKTDAPIRESPAVIGNTLYIGDDDGVFYALSN